MNSVGLDPWIVRCSMARPQPPGLVPPSCGLTTDSCGCAAHSCEIRADSPGIGADSRRRRADSARIRADSRRMRTTSRTCSAMRRVGGRFSRTRTQWPASREMSSPTRWCVNPLSHPVRGNPFPRVPWRLPACRDSAARRPGCNARKSLQPPSLRTLIKHSLDCIHKTGYTTPASRQRPRGGRRPKPSVPPAASNRFGNPGPPSVRQAHTAAAGSKRRAVVGVPLSVFWLTTEHWTLSTAPLIFDK